MNKILEYGLSFMCWLNAGMCLAAEKFEILPDLPDPLAAYAQSAEASTVSGNAGASSLLGGQSIGHEPSLISVVFSLLIVLLLIYLTGIIYAKLNKFGFNTFKKQQGILSKSQVSVVSTTALGSNKTLHVVELDGKRMLIGASSGAIQLIKDLGAVDKSEMAEDYSSIEIPTIKIPKIEIPKIEIPTVSFSKLATKIHKEFIKDSEQENIASESEDESGANTESPDVIIDSLFDKQDSGIQEENTEEQEDTALEHVVDPDDYALYKKYL